MNKSYDSVKDFLIGKGLKKEDIESASAQMFSGYKRVRRLEGALPTKVKAYRGRGNESADILVISDHPDKHEQQTGLVGFSDYPILLTLFFNRLAIDFGEVYWTTAIKHVPERVNMSLIKSEFEYLKQEIDVINPAVIIALGTTPISSLAGEAIKIDKALGREFSYDIHDSLPSIPVIPIRHPRTFLDMDEDEFRLAIKETWQSIKSIDELL